MSKTTMLTLLTVLVFVPAVEAATYKWVDDKGRVHFSDIRPSQENLEVIPQPRRSTSSDDSSQQRMKSLIQSQKKAQEARQLKKEERKQQAAENKARAEGCSQAQKRLTQLKNSPARRLLITTDTGEHRRMTEKEQGDRIAALNERIADLCDR